MEFTIKIDITERFEKSLQELARAILFSGTSRTFSQYLESRNTEPEKDEVFVGYTANIPYKQAETLTETENAPATESERRADSELDAAETAAQNDDAEPGLDKAFKSWVKEVAAEQAEKKPAKKRASKKAENLAVETPKEPEPVIAPPQSENAPDAKLDQPTDAKLEPSELDVSEDDPMCGMTLMDAVQAVMREIGEKGLEMADVNARVRARAAEAGIAYSSIICLIKAIGYKEARRVALGEKQ